MERLTAQEIEAIRKRAENATEHPWIWVCDELVSTDGNVLTAENGFGVADVLVDEADAEFIANAREDIPKLLAEVERLREEITFISNVGGVTNAYDEDSVPISVKSWAERALNGGDA